jgi:hypothetical protein
MDLRSRNSNPLATLPPTTVSVYEGRDLVGRAFHIRGRWYALVADSRGLWQVGTFNNSRAAANAVYDACRRAG